MSRLLRWVACGMAFCVHAGAIDIDAADLPTTYSVGVAQVDITPDYPVRLSGFGSRRTESEGVTLPIWAKALAISVGADAEPVVLLTVDNLGIPASICDEVARRLAAKAGLKRSRLAITASHTHTAPMLRGVAPTLFGQPIPDEQWQRIDRYTAELTDHLEQVALSALKDRQPARLTWGVGSVKFAKNRRTKGGPVDHDLPLLVVKSLDGKIRAIYVNYACHCVTLSNNKISGDWVGYAQDIIQREYPSAVAMMSIGCGADQNPLSDVTGDKVDICQAQGAEIASEVKRLLSGFLAPISGDISSVLNPITLEFAEPKTRAEWEEIAKKTDATGYHARVQLARLDRGEVLQSKLEYPIATWAFGDSLAMVFLPGEVVVDYALRLKKELDGRRLWVNAYANDEPCYIPSERVLTEGGYEGATAMIYYDRPGPFKPGLEAQIINAVRQSLDAKFASPFDANKTQGSLPKSPWQSLAMLQTTPNLRVDLVVSEPLIQDPVAIDFGLNGELWVAEMRDYPTGVLELGEVQPSADAKHEFNLGQIRLVRDRDGDGQFDSSTVFLEGIPYPTGVTVWRGGILVCSAPDILYAEDTDGDDHADIVKKLYSGFGTRNRQARVNSLCYGLDGWIYGSCGLFGGTIINAQGTKFELGDRDFRIKPETGEIEAATGRTQQGRVRDDFGNWFGCDNSNLAFHYPLSEHDLRRNPYVVSPPARVNVFQSDDARQLFPARADAQRFALSGPPGKVTAACGIGIYHDSRLGPEYTGNLFTCEPVNLLVHRVVLKPNGTSFIAERPANETRTEFLRSTDGWFRPVQAITGPDGGLWVVDMYRFLIEDPRWIPEHELAPLDVRAGSLLGRIYRVRNADSTSPPATRFQQADRLVHAQQTDNQQSSVYRELKNDQTRWRREILGTAKTETTPKRGDPKVIPQDPHTRIAYYRQMTAEGTLSTDDIFTVMKDAHPGVRKYGLLLAENFLRKDSLPDEVVALASDGDAQVRLQAAFSLGSWQTTRSGPILAKIALRDSEEPNLVAAVFSSLTRTNLQTFTKTLFAEFAGKRPPTTLMAPFLATAVGYSDDAAIRIALIAVTTHEAGQPQAWQLDAVANLAESLSKRSKTDRADTAVVNIIRTMHGEARTIATDESCEEELRLAAINLLGYESSRLEADVQRLGQLLSAAQPPLVRTSAIDALERIGADSVPLVLAQHFRELPSDAQGRVVDALLGRDAWARQLLIEIAVGTIPQSALNAAQRQELVTHSILAIRERAIKVLAVVVNSDRQQIVNQYRESLALTGDVERGRAIFTKNCAQCHKLGETGHAVGPDLSMVANKTASFLLQEILDPNRNVDSRYTTYTAVTKNGLSRSGILSSESATSLVLLAAEGKQHTLLRRDIDEIRASGKSLMPEGLEKELSHQAVADVIAFLGLAPRSSKQFAGNVPAVITPIAGRLDLPAAKSAIFGDQIAFESQFGNIGYWHGLQDHVVWKVELPDAGTFDIYLDYACDAAAAGNNYRIEADASSVVGQVKSTGGWDKYTFSKVGAISLTTGDHQILFRPDGNAIRGALIDLRSVYLVPTGEKFVEANRRLAPSAREICEIGARILDDKLNEAVREALIAEYASLPAALIAAMTLDIPVDSDEEYRRIPWIWRVAVACGKRNQADQIRATLDVSMPQKGQPLHDWQAVVIGGGIIHGIGLGGAWPGPRLEEILRLQGELTLRWQQVIAAAVHMADDDATPYGTRYDALRIVALSSDPQRLQQLAKYLAKGTDDELQMGAISGLSDIESNETSKLLLENFNNFSQDNRSVAIDALIRTDSRSIATLDAVANGHRQKTEFNQSQRKSLLESKNPSIRARASTLLTE